MIDPLRLTILNSATTLRCLVGFALFLIASSLLRLALKLMPRSHPGRTYATGHWHTGHTRISEALGLKATARYVTNRR